MVFADTYERQVRLLVRALPLIMDDERLALKGGTAINLFIRDLPRLSVDIDLVWLPIQPRDVALARSTWRCERRLIVSGAGSTAFAWSRGATTAS